MRTPLFALSAVILAGVAVPAPAGEPPKLLKVLADTSSVGDVLADADSVWFSTFGGIRRLDRKSGKWTHYTRHDGLVSNYVWQLARSGDDVIAFHSRHNHYSILSKGEKRWKRVPLDRHLKCNMIGFGGGDALSHFVARPKDIWCVFTMRTGGCISWPTLIELRQYSRSEPKLLSKVELYKQKDPKKPVRMPDLGVRGLLADGESIWAAMPKGILRIEAGGKKVSFPLPPEAVIHYRNLQETRVNRIHALCMDGETLWARLEQGLGRLDRKSGKWKLLLQEAAYRGGSSNIVSSGESLWFSNRADLIRFEKSTGKVRKFKGTTEYQHYVLHADDAEVWTNQGRLTLPAGKWDNPARTPRFSPSRTILVEDRLLVLGGEKLFVHDLATRVSRNLDVAAMEALVCGNSVWLFSQKAVHHFSTATGKLERRSDSPFGKSTCTRLRLLKSSGDKHWYYAETYQRDAENANAAHFLIFDAAKGKLEMVVTVPEPRRCDNAEPGIITDRHAYIFSGKGVYRFDLRERRWETAPKELQLSKGYGMEVFYGPGGIWQFHGGEMRLLEGKKYTKVYKLGPYIQVESRSADLVEFSSRDHVLRFDGKRWTCAARKRENRRYTLVRGLDAKGRPTDLYALTEAGDVSVWRGSPKPQKKLVFKPVEVAEDGTLRLLDPQ
jgi:hypothetical protein